MTSIQEPIDAPLAAGVVERLHAAGIGIEYGAERAHPSSARGSYVGEARDRRCLSAEELDLLLEGAPWRRIVALGDSTIEGLGDPVPGYQTHPFVERLVAALRRQQPNLRYHNLGERNLTVAEVRDTQLERALAYKPDLVILVAGGNDMFPPEWDPAGVERTLDQIHAALRGTGAELITSCLMNACNAVPMFKGTLLDERLPELNRRIRSVAGRHGSIVVDHENSAPSFDVTVFSHDYKHATMRGHAIVAGNYARALFAHLHPDAAAELRRLSVEPVPPATTEATIPTTPLTYGATMDATRLQAMPMFADLMPAELDRIALYAGERGVPAGETIITQGDYSHEMSLIEHGTVDVVRDGEIIASLGAGAVIGETGLLRRTTRNASVIATSDVRVITLTSWDLGRMPDRIVDRLAELMEERLRADAARLAVEQSAAPQ